MPKTPVILVNSIGFFYQIRQLLIHIFSLHHCLMRVLYLDYENYLTMKLIVENIDLFSDYQAIVSFLIYFDLYREF
jgi:hypothetical protein